VGLVLACLALAAQAAGCAAPVPPATPTMEAAGAVRRIAPQAAAGLFFGLTSPAQRDETDQLAVAAGERLVGRLTLANYSLFDEFQVVCLVDYRQVPCAERPLALGLGEEAALPLSLGPFPEGLHQ